jgi:hypothetical protein
VDDTQKKQDFFVYLAAAVQLLTMLALNAFAYYPYYTLIKALRQRG